MTICVLRREEKKRKKRRKRKKRKKKRRKEENLETFKNEQTPKAQLNKIPKFKAQRIEPWTKSPQNSKSMPFAIQSQRPGKHTGVRRGRVVNLVRHDKGSKKQKKVKNKK